MAVRLRTDGGAIGIPLDPRRVRTEYLVTTVPWFTEFTEEDGDFNILSDVIRPTFSFQAGRQYREAWNNAVFGPSLAAGTYAVRLPDDLISVFSPLMSDASGRFRFATRQRGTGRLRRPPGARRPRRVPPGVQCGHGRPVPALHPRRDGLDVPGVPAHAMRMAGL